MGVKKTYTYPSKGTNENLKANNTRLHHDDEKTNNNSKILITNVNLTPIKTGVNAGASEGLPFLLHRLHSLCRSNKVPIIIKRNKSVQLKTSSIHVLPDSILIASSDNFVIWFLGIIIKVMYRLQTLSLK